MKTLAEFVAQNGIELKSKQVPFRPDGLMGEMPPGSTHWVVAVKYNHKYLSTYFSRGPGHKTSPGILDVLSCLVNDASVKESCDTPEDVLAEFGYEDIEEAERIFAACLDIHQRLQALLGETLLNELIFDVEPY